MKAFLLKFSVGLIVIQGLIVQFMALTNSEPYNDDNDLSAEDKTIRGYCKSSQFPSFFSWLTHRNLNLRSLSSY